jgi:putative transposase
LQEAAEAIHEVRGCNPTWGCPRIAEQITLAFGVDIDKDVVRRILGMHYRPESGSGSGTSTPSFKKDTSSKLQTMNNFGDYAN